MSHGRSTSCCHRLPSCVYAAHALARKSQCCKLSKLITVRTLRFFNLILVAGAQFSGLARSHVVPPPGCGQAVCGPQGQRSLVVHYLRWYMFTDGITVRSITTSIGCNYSSATRKILFPGLTCAFGAHLRRLLLLASARSQAAWLPGTLFTTNSSVNV